MGGAISDEVLEVLRATIICGAANNQLAHPGIEKQVAERGILYAPDVFDYLRPERRRGVRPNALATLSEMVAGYWNRSGPSADTGDMYARQGVALSDTDRMGPRYPFLVGARNDFVHGLVCQD